MCEQDTFLDTIGMLSVARAAEGGTSYFSSILAAYDDLADHQDVEPLFTGWRKRSSSLASYFAASETLLRSALRGRNEGQSIHGALPRRRRL